MKKKRTKNKLLKLSEFIRRKNELDEYGKLVSLRPSQVMKSKKDYKRKWKLSDYGE